VEIGPHGVDKAVALGWLATHLGLDRADVWAFGDGINDVDMLRWAGRGIAMANADEAVLAVADEVTMSNDDDGVAVVLERLVHG
jgi:hydroxymethylpyrimidine pyrophosphatase-like HAD family hydrolase